MILAGAPARLPGAGTGSEQLGWTEPAMCVPVGSLVSSSPGLICPRGSGFLANGSTGYADGHCQGYGGLPPAGIG